ncbi:MAG: QacE family quaternary ammonium compound efflux SMR transporter [Ancylobacter novellus]|uniref:Guanidinium exporter n=1 Tax=Ancylobacter novellus TaxID=921 RepID=A0A2W5QU45_ANCNO|nr:MAG: QacE family quaternary ammonium compound efflux SMR transporter [Ancylobacter novellus]
MPWVLLAVASLFEVLFTFSLKYAEGFTRLVPSLFTVATGLVSLVFLSLAMRTLPMSIAYPAWAAVGMLGTVVLGATLFNEPLTTLKMLSVGAILIGIVGLKLQAA